MDKVVTIDGNGIIANDIHNQQARYVLHFFLHYLCLHLSNLNIVESFMQQKKCMKKFLESQRPFSNLKHAMF